MNADELSDFSACVVLQVRNEAVFILDVVRERLEFPNLRRKVIELHRRWRPITTNYTLLIENKGSGMSLIQDLKCERIYAALPPRDQKATRLSA